MTGPQRAKSLVSSIPEGMRSSRRSSSKANLFPSPALCPCRSLSGTQPAAVHLDPFAEADGFFSADFAQCREPVAAEGTETSSPWRMGPCTLAAVHLGCMVPRMAPHPISYLCTDPEVSIKGKRKEASRVWRHSHVAPLGGGKPAQVTTLCQNSSRRHRGRVRAGICHRAPVPVAVSVGSSTALDPLVGSLCCRELELLRPVMAAAAGQHSQALLVLVTSGLYVELYVE